MFEFKLVKKIVFYLIMLVLTVSIVNGQQKKVMTFKDVMKFKQIKKQVVSEEGNWIAYVANPDRGDGELVVRSTEDRTNYLIERGNNPLFSKDGKWLAAKQLPGFYELESAKKDEKPKTGLVLLNTESGKTEKVDSVAGFDFSADSKWIAYLCTADKKIEKKKKYSGSKFVLKSLTGDTKFESNFIKEFAFDSLSHYMAFSLADTNSKNNGLYLLNLQDENLDKILIDTLTEGKYSGFSWNKKGGLAFLKSVNKEKSEADSAQLFVWNNGLKKIADSENANRGWMLPSKNKIKWSHDNQRLFFGFKPAVMKEEKTKLDSTDIYKFDEIISKRAVDVWHWNDPLIKTNEKEEAKKNKDKTYTSVYHLNSNKIVVLADSTIPDVNFTDNPDYALGSSPVPYLKYRTWEGFFEDVYLVDLKTGTPVKAAERISGSVSMSPCGNYLVYYKDKNWHLFDSGSKLTKNLTEKLEFPFYNEDHDYPADVPGYGAGGWLKDEAAVLIYDKYDIWKFDLKTKSAVNLTSGEGRKNNLQFRIIKTNKEAKYISGDMLLRSYHDKEKYTTFYKLEAGTKKPVRIADINKKYSFKLKAADSDKIIFTRECFREFPDLWAADGFEFEEAEKLSGLGKQTEEYLWGSTELVEWNSVDGRPLRGIVIKPENYDPNKKYPVLVYYYRFFTPRMYNFPDVVVNHRPNYPVYSSHDYVIFLPDILFDIGYPGWSSVKCLVPGVQKLIDMGIADPDAIGLHGHSWSGYQTAFVVTQTDIFKCAVAGAPVSNMTSAYSGIRWGTGLARQFQYEKTQSRIGGSLWEYPERYIQNSPVFYADRINTPLLIQHGDIDEAVPWYQSIEFYLAMRRLGKDCIFLQYRDEPHHLKKYPNKLDYSIKMKHYFDHHLKGEEAADWITTGVPYSK